MKYLVIFLILIGSIGSVSAQYIGNSEDTGLIWPPICLGGSACPPYEEWIKGIFNNAISEPFDKSDTVIVGTIIQVENLDPHSIRYSIDVEFYLKNAQPFDSLSATLDDPVEPESFPDVLLYNSPVFEKDDLVFVYLKKVNGSYNVLLQSFAIDKHEVRGPPPTIIFPTDPYQRNFEQGDEVVISGIVRKAELYNVAKQGETLDVKVTIYHNDKVISDNSVGIDSDGKYSYNFHTMKTPPGTYEIDVNFGPSTISDRITIEPNLKYWTPLKQYKSGITIDEILCRESLTLVTKYDKSPACVKSESIPKLVERGWIFSESQIKNCPDDQTYNEVLFKCVIACDGDLVYNGFTNTCTTEFELKYHGFCNDGFIYNPSSHECVSDVDGFSQHMPLKDPPRTPPPEPEPESKDEMQLYDAKKLLQTAYREHVNLGPYYMKDVIAGFGTYDNSLIIDIPSKYTNQSSIQIIKKEIRHIVGDHVNVDLVVYDRPIETHIGTVIPYLWNQILNQNKIEFTPRDQSYWNNADGFHDPDRVCSPLVALNGTEFYISSTFDLEPFEITGTFIDKIKPDDCHKIWKTDVIMTEPDRVTALWLENEN